MTVTRFDEVCLFIPTEALKIIKRTRESRVVVGFKIDFWPISTPRRVESFRFLMFINYNQPNFT